MADTKTLITREAESIRPSPLSFDDISRRAERRVRRRRLSAGIVGVAASLAVVGLAFVAFRGTDRHPAQPAAANYEFDVHGIGVPIGAVRFPDPSTAGIDSTLSWSTNVFPGVHQCTARAFADDGSPVGSESFRMMSMSQPAHPVQSSLEVTAPPATAEITCDPERLDVGEPYAYEFRGAHVDDATRTVVADATWQGPAASGAVTCLVRVLAPGGELVAVRGMNVYSAEGTEHAVEIRFHSNEVLDDAFYTGNASAFDVRFDCRPFDGSPPPSPPAPDTTPTAVEPVGVSVAVFNATTTDGLASGLGERLRHLGYTVVETSNFPGPRGTTAIYFASEAERGHAEQLAGIIDPGATIGPLPTDDPAFQERPAADLVVVLGDDLA